MDPTVSPLLERLRSGDPSAFGDLVAALYPDLHRIASRHLHGERPDHTLQTTALVHEAYLKLASSAGLGFSGEAHFLAVASRVMRQILVDYARGRATQKRSANLEVESDRGPQLLDLIELDTALIELAEEDSQMARLIEMHYFAGMTAEQTSEVTGISVHVVRHDLRLAQAWLRRRLSR